MLAGDIDFSENGSIENFDKVQSEHWISKQYTLFMSITSFLKFDEWNDEENKLDVGAEVTVNGEHYVGELKEKIQINLDSHWEKVIGHNGGSEDVYQVEYEGGRLHEVLRSSLRHHSRHIICCGHFTDDKCHDRFAMQQFTDEELQYIENYMSDNFPNDLINRRIKQLHQHSDNASQHFRSTGALEYFMFLIKE